ncbi:MAG TPA: T9SS type A sorting domain-containing protein [Ginsengibacter sp.]|nr:T9SS type A sorting domain-containing protein [Ginsengibacter sp.]HRP16877.1 T9SS type A sorting domain-containing protein [Ginsengibacter sp.]HRP44307.1 T9SS type A sorting domain-containing protein [Ginsengibacter sp.]
MKRIFYIILLTGLSFSAYSQIRPGNSSETMKVAKLYPNPAVNFVNFEFDHTDKTGTIVIFNFIGKKVDEIKVTDSRMTLSLNDYYRGIYIFQLRNAQGAILESGKFQVAR